MFYIIVEIKAHPSPPSPKVRSLSLPLNRTGSLSDTSTELLLKEQGATGKEEGGNNLLPKEMVKVPFAKHVVKNLSITFYINLFALASIEFLCIVNTSFFILKVLDELTMAKNNYIALNSQLLEELPRLSKKCLQFFHFCLSNFVKARFRYFTEISDELTLSLQVLPSPVIPKAFTNSGSRPRHYFPKHYFPEIGCFFYLCCSCLIFTLLICTLLFTLQRFKLFDQH